MSEIPSPIVGPVEYRCSRCDVTINPDAKHSCAETRIAELESYLRNLLADIDHAWATRAVPGLRFIEMQVSRNETEELRKLIGGKR